MVEYNESAEGRQFEGLVSKIEIMPAEGKFPSQYKITIKPTSENAAEWKNQTIFISIPHTATDKIIPRKSFLGFMCKALEVIGLTGETHKELIDSTFEQTFVFKDLAPKIDGETITKKEKLVWISKV